MKDKDRSQIYN